jgi:hypothetical protein
MKMTARVTPGLEATPHDDAILSTLLYGDVFNYPMTAAEVHRFLIGLELTPEQVSQALHGSAWLAERTERVNGFFAARGRAAEVAAVRERREQASRHLWRVARRYAFWVGHLPFVRMVAVTGALAMDNSEADDDIDFLVVTAPGRVWLTRALCIGVVRLARLLGANLCPNYVLAETALLQQRQDLFTAHEVAQMTPMVGHALYEEMRRANAWAYVFLPNAHGPPRQEADAAPRSFGRAVQQWLEWMLGGRLGDRLEEWESRRKVAKFRPQAQSPAANVLLDAEHVKGHFRDHGRLTMLAYGKRLRAFGVDGISSIFPAAHDTPGGLADSPG